MYEWDPSSPTKNNIVSDFLSPPNRLKQMLTKLKESEIDRDTLVSNLEYVAEVVQCVVAKIE